LARYTKDIFLVFDSDLAGLKNLSRSIKMYQSFGLENLDIKFIPVCLPKHKDPDEFLRHEGRQEYFDVLAEAKKRVYETSTTAEYARLCRDNEKLKETER
jgi:DNA primase